MSSSNEESKFLSRERIGELQIMGGVLMFGISFTVQRYAMTNFHIGPITYNACRFIISTFLLLVTKPCAQSVFHTEVEQDSDENISANERQIRGLKELWFWGVLCGLAGLGGSILQQIGLVTVSAGKTGFITGMFVIFVPIVEWLTPGFGVNLTIKTWCAVFVSLIGLYLLSGCAEQDVCLGGAVGNGEIVVFISMLCWVFGIMWSDIGAKRVDVLSLTTVDFSVVTFFTVFMALYFEPQYWIYPYPEIQSAWVPIVVVGITEAAGFALSTLGQMYSTPTQCSVLFSMESVSCAILGFFFLGERMSVIEIFGCCLMTASALYISIGDTDEVSEAEEEAQEIMALEYTAVDTEAGLDEHSEHDTTNSNKSSHSGSGGSNNTSDKMNNLSGKKSINRSILKYNDKADSSNNDNLKNDYDKATGVELQPILSTNQSGHVNFGSTTESVQSVAASNNKKKNNTQQKVATHRGVTSNVL